MQLLLAAQKIKTRISIPPPPVPRKISQDQEILGEDGIECFDLDMLQSDAQDDLRLSIGAQMMQQKMPPPILKNGSTA